MDLYAVFVVPALHLKPTSPARPAGSPPADEDAAAPLSPRSQALVAAAVTRCHDAVAKRRILMIPVLQVCSLLSPWPTLAALCRHDPSNDLSLDYGVPQDYDRLHNSHITASQFRAALGSLGLTLTDAEYAACTRRFGDAAGFRYRDFVATVEAPTA